MRHEIDPAEAAKWESILAGSGMPAELGEDKAAKALARHKMEEEGIPVEEIRKAIQEYFASTRSEGSGGQHRVMAGEIQRKYGITMPAIDSLMEEVRDEITAVERELKGIADALKKRSSALAFRPDSLERAIRREATGKFSHISQAAFENLIQRIMSFEQN